MLGLPVLSAQAGFQPSVVTFFVCWAFMLCTGLLLLEVNLWIGKEVSLLTMAEQTLGQLGKYVAGVVFLFLFYALMVAYIAATGDLAADWIELGTGYRLPHGLGELGCCLLLVPLLYADTRAVDWCNRFLMGGLIISYLCLIGVGAPQVQTVHLLYRDWGAAPLVIPAVIVSFGFHNLIPSLTTYFHGEVSQLKRVLIGGSLIPLVIYLIWEWLILGLVPFDGFQQALAHGESATEALRETAGRSWVVDVAELFAFFALVTSFLGVALSFLHFLADGLRLRQTAGRRLALVTLVLFPPFLCALFYPEVFLTALNLAGGFGAVVLFGLFPALMVWKGRGRNQQIPPLVPGGRMTLGVILLFSFTVILLQLTQIL